MKDRMKTERDVFIEENVGIRNVYLRSKTRFGEIDHLNIPRDREGKFRTALLDPYST